MLTIIEIKQREQIKKIYDQFDPSTATWIVSDLKSKLEIQNKILTQDHSFHDESVLRIGDLWQKILNRKYPEIKIVSEDYAQILILQFLSNYQKDLDMSDKNIKSIFSYIDLFSSILFHAQGKNQLDEWFTQNTESAFRWKKWFLIAQLSVNYLIEKQQVICRSWIASFLQNEIELHKYWQRKLFIDLGSELSKVEAQLIKQLQLTNEILVINPTPVWEARFTQIKSSYVDLYQQATQVISLPLVEIKQSKKIEQLRFSGMLSEVKHAVAQVRNWLDQGADLENIALISSNIEEYWPVISRYFDYEGIPVQKEKTTRLNSFPNVANWFARLKLMDDKRFEYQNLEKVYFDSYEKQSEQIRYEKFHAQFAEIFSLQEASEIQKSELIKFEFNNTLELLKRDQFIQLAMECWIDQDFEHLEVIIQELILMSNPNDQFRLSNWLDWVQKIILKKEIKIQQAPLKAIQFVKIQAAHSLAYRYRIFLNLSDEAIRKSGSVHLSKDDYFNLNKDLGFSLQNPEISQVEYELLFVSEMQSAIIDQYCFSQTNFEGQLLTPSQFWLGLGDCHQLTVPEMTRLDELQHLKLPCKLTSQSQVENEINKTINHTMKWSSAITLSSTALTEYYQCPFIFAAKKYYYLEDHAKVDLDADARTHGIVVHKIFEKILMNKVISNINNDQIKVLVRLSFEECEFKTTAEVITNLYINKYVKIVQRFIQFETKWRSEYSHFQTIGCETMFSFYLNLKTLEIRKVKNRNEPAAEDEIYISGKIDRIDLIDHTHLVVYDYKSSTDKAHQFSTWLKYNEFQLLIYLLVIYHDLVDELKGKSIGGAFLYNFRKFDFKFGILKNELQEKIGISKKSFNDVNQATFEQMIQELKLKIQQAAGKILNGDLQPKPKDLSTCQNCQWSRACRAPHLN